MKVIAFVPMRHASERVVGKNYRSFADRPLYHYIIRTLLKCPLITHVYVDTDSSVIMEDAFQHFPQVTFIERPEHLRAETTPMNDVLLYDVTQVQADYYLQTHSTNPLLQEETITRALRFFLDHTPMYDSLFSVTNVQTRLWDSLTRPINHNPSILLRTQDLPPVYEENSCLYLFTRSVLEKKHNRIGERPFMFEIARLEAWDIDNELDFRVAEFLLLEREKTRTKEN